MSLVEILDFILFKGKTHLKRGAGFTRIPDKLLMNKLCHNRNFTKEITHAFTHYFK
jgi:hypothetical protein